ncbi:MAG: phosphatidylserine decarboxylase [Emergencia sp.]|jgi:phosphatidylserine decarboxylase|nr:phosphatidylserine decarboxylase [Emergencia sp.]
MDCKDRKGNIIYTDDGQDKLLEKLYSSACGRFLLRFLIPPQISKFGGFFLSRKISRIAIDPFIRKNQIDMTQYESRKFCSYNDFFTRKIKPECRPIDLTETHLIAPCDSRLTVYPITSDSRFTIKNTEYTMKSLLRDEDAAETYEGGQLLLFRLTVKDYHRYCYPDSGILSKIHKIPGVFHTVNPIANDYFPIYKENTRSYCYLESAVFGTMLMMEVGALMVGKICNYEENCTVVRGTEKGRFEFGGSTIILCLPAGSAIIDPDILANTSAGFETRVKYGEKIGIHQTENALT